MNAAGDEPEAAVRLPGRPPLSRDFMLATALRIVDEGGAESLSMRSLAQRMNSSTATIYRHYPNRAALIIDIIDLVMAEVDLDAGDLDSTWRQACRRLACAIFDALGRHRNVAPLLAEHPPIGRNSMAPR